MKIDNQLIDAVLRCDRERIKFLIGQGASPNAIDSEHEETALMLAAQFCDSDTVKLLLSHGARLEDQDDRGRNALFAAVGAYKTRKEEKCHEIMTVLLEYGIDRNCQDENGDTPLMYAVAHTGNADLVRFLLGCNVDTSILNGDEESAVDIARRFGNKVIEDLILIEPQ